MGKRGTSSVPEEVEAVVAYVGDDKGLFRMVLLVIIAVVAVIFVRAVRKPRPE